MKRFFALALVIMMMATSFAFADEAVGFSPVGTWNFSGAMVDGAELDLAGAEAVLAQYGGTLQIVLGEDGSAAMVQGNIALLGVWAVADETGVGLVFDNNGEQLAYACNFTEVEGEIVMLLTNDNVNYLYFTILEEVAE